jgi:nucleoside-diphosphate-sugar epimerase
MPVNSYIFHPFAADSPFYNIYAQSKRHAEELAVLYCRRTGLPLSIIRPPQIYGDGELFRKHQPFLYSIMDKAQLNEDITLNGTGAARRNIMHAEDVAQVIARVIRKRITGLFTCPNPNNTDYAKIAAAAVVAFASTSSIKFDIEKADATSNAFGRDDALYLLIDYFPKISLVDGIRMEAARRKKIL